MENPETTRNRINAALEQRYKENHSLALLCKILSLLLSADGVPPENINRMLNLVWISYRSGASAAFNIVETELKLHLAMEEAQAQASQVKPN